MASELHPGDEICPCCDEATSSLKHFIFVNVLFIFISISVSIVEIVACPRCLRRWMWQWGLLSLLIANILWPVFIMPLWLTRWIASFRSGHVPPHRPWWKKAAGTIGIVATALCCIVICFCLAIAISNLQQISNDVIKTSGIALLILAASTTVAVFADA